MPKRAFIFVNGQMSDPAVIRVMINPEDDLIAADRGLIHLMALGLTPNLLVGDLDSLEPADLQWAQARGVTVKRFPPEKDETDLELALRFALERGAKEIRIVAALGGRVDMTLSHVLLLSQPELQGLDVRLDDGREQVCRITAETRITGRVGERVSLLAVHGPAEGVETEGLYYPLRGETLWPERARGLSNVLQQPEAVIRLQRGSLICIHTRSSEGELEE